MGMFIVDRASKACSVLRDVVTLAHRAPRGGRAGGKMAAVGAEEVTTLTPPAESAEIPMALYLKDIYEKCQFS